MGLIAAPSSAIHVVDATMFWSATGGGVRRYLQTKHAWLAAQAGWRHTLAVPLPKRDRTAAAPAGIVSLPAWPIPRSGGYRLPLSRAAVAQVLEGLQPQLIEAGDPYVVGWAALDAAAHLRIPAVAYCHSNLEMMARLAAGPHLRAAAGRAARAYARRLYSRYDLVFAPSHSMCRHLSDWGVPQVQRQALGVDTQTFTPSRASRAWREQLGFAASDRVLVYAGRFAAEKHLEVLAAAVDRLGAPYTLLAIGAGPRPPQGQRVRVLHFVAGADALATALASADAFVHAGDQETFGLSVLEAMACGTPVVARVAEGLAELVDDRVGIAVESAGVDAFAQAIAALFAEDRASRQIAARQRAETYAWEHVLPNVLTHYQRLLRHSASTVDEVGHGLPAPTAAPSTKSAHAAPR